MPEPLPSFSDYMVSPYDLKANAPPPPSDIPATGTGNWLTAGLMSGFHGALSEGARALQAGAQLVGADETAQSLADFAEAHHATEQSYARPDLEEHPWSPTGI